MKKSVIIAGAGSGKRMGQDTPKQFLEIGGKAIILRTIERFATVFPDIEIIVVLAEHHLSFWEKLNCRQIVTLVNGGEERFFSVKNALEKTTGEVIAIHDAVRPFVADEVIRNAFEKAAEFGAVIPVVPVKESLRRVIFDESEAVPRGSYRIVQTPQVFRADIIKPAYNKKYHIYFTDDAAVVEDAGKVIHLIDGNEENIKITTPFDLQVAEQLLLAQN